LTISGFGTHPLSDSTKRLHVPLSRLAQRVLGPRQQGKVFGHIDLDRLQAKLRTLCGIWRHRRKPLTASSMPAAVQRSAIAALHRD
jgi:hypothetical protein